MHLPSIVLHVYNLRHSSAESEIDDQLTVGVEILEFCSSRSASMRVLRAFQNRLSEEGLNIYESLPVPKFMGK